MKTSSPCTFYFVALAVSESVAGMKEGRVLRFRDTLHPHELFYILSSLQYLSI